MSKYLFYLADFQLFIFSLSVTREHFRIFFLILFGFVLYVSPDAIASDVQPVGRIVSRDNCSPPPRGYMIKSGHRTVTSDDIQLYEEDLIVVKEPQCRLTIEVRSTNKTLDMSSAPYPVPKIPGYSTFERVLFSLQEVMSGKGQGTEKGHSRGEDDQDLLLPLLDWDSKIAAGSRTLSIPWGGGEGPFEIRLTMNGNDKNPLAYASNVSARSIIFKGVSLRPGKYTVTVSGKRGDSVRGFFQVINSKEIPQMPQSMTKENVGGYPLELLYAWWLSSSGNGEFVFEAYQQIASLDDSKKEISRLKAFFEQGGRLRLD